MRINTYSIIARCPKTGHFGGAAASKFPGLGAFSPLVESKWGAVAVQGWVNPYAGMLGIEMLKQGFSAKEVMESLLKEDPGRDFRQISVLDHQGNAVAHTGKENDDWKGHLVKDNFCLQGNLLTGPEVLDDMYHAFNETNGPLAERLIAALSAGEKAGGDKRGKQAAVIKVVAEPGFPYVDFRVDDAAEPVKELERLYWEHKHLLIDCYDEWIQAVKAGRPMSKPEKHKED